MNRNVDQDNNGPAYKRTNGPLRMVTDSLNNKRTDALQKSLLVTESLHSVEEHSRSLAV